MTDYSQPSSLSFTELGVDHHEDRDGQGEPIWGNINVSNAFALMRAFFELRLLQTTTAIMRVTRTNPVSIEDPESSIRRAIDRREHRIAVIIDRMTRESPEKSGNYTRSQHSTHVPTSPSELLETIAVAEEDSHEDESISHISSDPSLSIPELDSLADKAQTAVPVDDGARSERRGNVAVPNGRAPTEFPLSRPAPGSDSNYSSLGRSVSVSNVQSLASGPRQCVVISAAQYTKIVSERAPQFSIVSQPYSIDSLVAESTRVDRSALEINGHCQQKSADSFPGEFPASDGMEFSSLATANYHIRIPSMRTSVRPFSDL
ncbi:hypothetical protein BJX61DRAFT_363892 [Aspergillus egyptiacus]|nr:hypothetical protein BJX61DRAFT_363892 [Aspergillus egyptiacus]